MPRNVPTIIVTNAISRLATSERVSDSFWKNCVYHSVENPPKRCSERRLLNEKSDDQQDRQEQDEEEDRDVDAQEARLVVAVHAAPSRVARAAERR